MYVHSSEESLPSQRMNMGKQSPETTHSFLSGKLTTEDRKQTNYKLVNTEKEEEILGRRGATAEGGYIQRKEEETRSRRRGSIGFCLKRVALDLAPAPSTMDIGV